MFNKNSLLSQAVSAPEYRCTLIVQCNKQINNFNNQKPKKVL